MKVLITGGSGYVGKHLTAECVKRGWVTHLILRPDSKIPTIIDEKKIIVHRFHGKTEQLVEILSAEKFDGVFHLATHFCAEHKRDDIPALIDANVLFGAQLLQAMMETSTPLLINTGTAWQNFQNDPYNPVSLYAATKQCFTDLMKFFTEIGKIRSVTIKIYDSYGPNDTRKKIVPVLLDVSKKVAASESVDPIQMSKGEQEVCFVHIHDVIDAHIKAFEYLLKNSHEKNIEFACRTDEVVTLRRFVELFQESTGVKLPITWGARPYRTREIMTIPHIADTVPGWKPSISLREGIKACFNSMQH